MTTATKTKIDTLIKSTRLLTRMYGGDWNVHFYRMLTDYYTRLRDARANGDFVVAHTIFFPVEIFNAMNLAPMYLEGTGYMMSLFSGSCADSLAHASEIGMAPEICSAHRMVDGSMKQGELPRIDAVVCSNLVCDNGYKSGEFAMEYNRCPGFIFDYPYNLTDAGRRFVMRELKDVIDFLEQVSGRKMDWNRLWENIVESDKQIRLIRQINNLCKSVPSPFQPLDFLKFLTNDYMFSGAREYTLYLEAMHDRLKEMVTAGKGFADPERLRLMCLMPAPFHLQSTVDAILKENGAAIVCFPVLTGWPEDFSMDPSRPLESIAAKLEACPTLSTFGPLDERNLAPIRNGVGDYKIDGAISFGHLGCRNVGPLARIYKDVLNEMDIPLLHIDCDMVDPTVTGKDEVRSKMEAFFELLEDR